jgi:hypothetical protein
MTVSISFPHREWPDRVIDPVEFAVDVDGALVLALIDLAVLESLTKGGPDSAVRDFVSRNRGRIERAIEAHILARGVPPNRVIAIELDELREAFT